MVCNQEGGGGDCRRRNVTYVTSCDICRQRNKEDGIEDDNENVARYFGKTALSSFERSLNHGNDLKAGKEDSHILKHKSLKHPNEEVTFSMKIVKRHQTCFQRLCHESVLIEMNENLNILNSKNSFNRAAIPRLAILVSDKVIEEENNEEEDAQDMINKRRKKKIFSTEDDTPKPPKRRKTSNTLKSNSSTNSTIFTPLLEVKSLEKDTDSNRSVNLQDTRQQQFGINNNYFSIFNSNKSERGSHLREGKKKKLTRTGRKTKPPPFKFKALNQYFVENSKRNLETSSDRPNDPED